MIYRAGISIKLSESLGQRRENGIAMWLNSLEKRRKENANSATKQQLSVIK